MSVKDAGHSPLSQNYPENIPLHTRWFAQATVTDTGLRSLLTGAKALALTALDLLVDDLWRSVQAEYAQKDYGPGISQ